ncbi:TAF4 Transcription initiation factor TFIID subunit 4 [Candida maltosa Xu316]|uniref:Transcription initiation factor TFIID subunit 4 n=1 Tax=Candida maltosa (strain Xu316) TaxID=1245528 RepID=M3HII4_CANMX|nr:Transcription initiation factor TFIID subunit 4 [Candida maltosa Xu316]
MASSPQEQSSLKRVADSDANLSNKKIKLENNKIGEESIESEFSNLPVTLLQNETQGNSTTTNQSNTKDYDQDTSKLNDAIAAAGVDIQQEEEILLQQQLNRKSTDGIASNLKNVIKASKPPPFLNNYHLAAFMDKVAKENGIHQNFLMDGEMLELVSAACENWLGKLATKTIMLSRHRRRGIPKINKKSGSSSVPRSETSKELRALAIKQKEMEEKRVSKRVMLGLEKSINDPSSKDENGDSKAGAEETLHRAANATAAMMTSNLGKKKYSWMTSSANGPGGSDSGKAGATASKDGGKRESPIISVRGDTGLRFREIRSGNSVVMKDLLGAIEDEKMGTRNAVIKGYAKLKD